MSTRYRKGSQSLSSQARQRAKAAQRAKRLPCHLCGRPIDYRLAWPHPHSFSVDEVIPRSMGGSSIDPRNLRSSHLVCNTRRHNKPLAVALKLARGDMPRSRAW